jgi:hypothetical protein
MYKIFALLTLIVAPMLALAVSSLMPRSDGAVIAQPTVDVAPVAARATAAPVLAPPAAPGWSDAQLSGIAMGAPLPGAGQPMALPSPAPLPSPASAGGELVSPEGRSKIKE